MASTWPELHAGTNFNYVWDVDTLAWVKETQPGTGGGGGTGLTNTELRAAPVPVSGTFFQATQPVSIASMPSTPVTGTFWQATQPVSGPLTDTQLRATPVPVSGTVVTGGLTDAQLRASAVPVSAASLPLPTGAATAANQVAGNDSLDAIEASTASIDGLVFGINDTQTNGTQKSIVRGGVKGATAAADVSSTAQGANHQALDVTLYSGGALLAPALEATQALNNTALNMISASVSLIDATTTAMNAKIPALGQAVAGASTPVVLPAAQIATLTPPAAITGFALDSTVAKDTSLVDLRRNQERQLLAEMSSQIQLLLATENHTSQAVGYEVR